MNEPQAASPLGRYVVRFGGEAILIVVSVFVAILLESMWQDHAEAMDARESLAQVRSSLAEDRVFLDRVEKEQKAADAYVQRLIQWTSDPDSIPAAEVNDIFLNYSMPISIWPRRAAWDSMVSAGQLRLLGAPDLTTKIGDYYEHHLRRVGYNGQQYDQLFVSIFEDDLPRLWNFEEARLLDTDPDARTHFRNRLMQLRKWTEYYLNYVETNRELIDELTTDIDRFLH